MNLRTPLYDDHVQANAKFVDFSGWDMPVQYGSLTNEYLAVREKAGIFDVSHMGRFWISGPKAMEAIDRVVVSNIKKVEPGKARYTLVCNPDGGCKDDILVSRLNEDTFFVVVNASNREKLWNWFKEQFPDDVDFKDKTQETGMIAIQGPEALRIVDELVDIDPDTLGYFKIQQLSNSILLSRTGYTGEDGFEITAPKDQISAYWKKAVELCAKPAGLGARDLLRLEMGYPLYGHEINEEISPVQAGLGWTVHLKKEDFIGKDVLERQKKEGTVLQQIAFQLDGVGIPRQGCILYDGEEEVGEVTSGSFSPILKKGIGMGLVSHKPQDLQVGIRNKKVKAQLATLPFVESKVKK